MTKRSPAPARYARKGVALISVLYFLIVCGLAATALLFGQRSRATNLLGARGTLRLSAVADSALYAALAAWQSGDRLRQPVGSTIVLASASSPDVRTRVLVTRTTRRLFSIVAEATQILDGTARRVSLLVRVPLPPTSWHGALVSAVDVAIGAEARIVVDSACGDTTAAGILLAPSAALTLDSTAIAGAPS